MINKAQSDFRNRGNLDSRKFEVWYDNEDVQRLVWQIYQQISPKLKNIFVKPYVFYDGMEKNEHTNLNNLLIICKNLMYREKLKYFPFIVKPTVSSHYYAGFIHANPHYVYIFDPLGSDKENIKRKLGVQNDKLADLKIIFSTNKIQKKIYENVICDGLASCGPLCVEFLEHIMSVLPYQDTVTLPRTFTDLIEANDPSTYVSLMLALREKHDTYLNKISDKTLESEEIGNFHADLTNELLDINMELKKYGDIAYEAQLTEIGPEYNGNNIKLIIEKIYENLALTIKDKHTIPHIFDGELSANLLRAYNSYKNQKLDIPFLCKSKDSVYFAGIIKYESKQVSIFIPNGLVKESRELTQTLGLENAFMIGDGVLTIVKMPYNRALPDNSKVSSLLSIDYLEYELLYSLGLNNYVKSLNTDETHQNYIDKISRRHMQYLDNSHNSKSKQVRETNHQIYTRYFNQFDNVVTTAEKNTCSFTRAQKLTISDARAVLNELKKIDYFINNDLLLRLAALCSHMTVGLLFITQDQNPYQANIFQYTKDSLRGRERSIQYDLATHQKMMLEIRDTALLLPGSGLHTLKTVLLIIAGTMLVACGILLIGFSTPISSGLSLALSSTALVSAGVGFFVGRDIGLSNAVNKINIDKYEAEFCRLK